MNLLNCGSVVTRVFDPMLMTCQLKVLCQAKAFVEKHRSHGLQTRVTTGLPDDFHACSVGAEALAPPSLSDV
jgi:hypothetical protein